MIGDKSKKVGLTCFSKTRCILFSSANLVVLSMYTFRRKAFGYCLLPSLPVVRFGSLVNNDKVLQLNFGTATQKNKGLILFQG